MLPPLFDSCAFSKADVSVIAGHLAVFQRDHALGRSTDFRIVRDNHERRALCVQLPKEVKYDLLVLLVPFSCASDVSEQRPFETRIASAVSAASSGKTVQKAQAEADRAAAPAEKTEPENPSEPEMGTVQIEREDVVFMLETTAQNAYRITIDNRSDRDVNFGWVSTAYALLTTDQGTYRCDIGESQFQPVGAYTQRTFAVSFDGAEGTPQSLELVQLYHLDRRGLPSLGSFEGICFPFDAQN